MIQATILLRYINYLRKKIDKDASNKLIHTVVGMGYTTVVKMTIRTCLTLLHIALGFWP
ncbi:MAG: winged helix-turn-helix domain-containing protein [Spirosomataceae bacterium]